MRQHREVPPGFEKPTMKKEWWSSEADGRKESGRREGAENNFGPRDRMNASEASLVTLVKKAKKIEWRRRKSTEKQTAEK